MKSLLWLIVLCWSAPIVWSLPCAPGCTKFGTCYKPLGRCDCPWNRTGPACQKPFKGFCLQRPEANTCSDDHPSLCLNACNQRGKCFGGFCQCKEGYFGTDCSLSMGPDGKVVILAGLGYTPSPNKPKIFVYELPPEFHVRRDVHTLDRAPMHLALYERILSSGHRTTDGDEADFYYLPITSRDLKKGFLLQPALEYVARHWPYWNRTSGHRHLVPMEGDVGTCELPIHTRRYARNATWVQFWGLWGFHPSWEHIFKQRVQCHVPGKDLVVPFMAQSSHDKGLVLTPLRPTNPQPVRNTTFFFSGGVCGAGKYNAVPPHCNLLHKQPRYSGGVRQAVYEHFHNRSGWKVVTRTSSFSVDYSTSKFCLAAPGGGWGKRGIIAALYGCVPVSATDYLYEAFEPELNWGRFGVRVRQKDIPKLGDLLDNMPPAKLAELQRRTACAAQHLHWSTSLGGIMGETGEFDAFATIMAILRMRIKYPDADPSTYYSLDQEFRDFVNCVPAKRGKPLPPLCTMAAGPVSPRLGDICPKPRYYMRYRMGPPGGAVCVGASDMAHCRRVEAGQKLAAPQAEQRTKLGSTTTLPSLFGLNRLGLRHPR